MTRVGAVAPVIALIFLGACASIRASEGVPISDTDAIAGRWVGTVTPGCWGVEDPFALTMIMSTMS